MTTHESDGYPELVERFRQASKSLDTIGRAATDLMSAQESLGRTADALTSLVEPLKGNAELLGRAGETLASIDVESLNERLSGLTDRVAEVAGGLERESADLRKRVNRVALLAASAMAAGIGAVVVSLL